MDEYITGGGRYLKTFFMKTLRNALLAAAHEETHVCGFCANYAPLEDMDDYGDCELCSRTLGFDCEIGKSCDSFKRAKGVELDVKVVE